MTEDLVAHDEAEHQTIEEAANEPDSRTVAKVHVVEAHEGTLTVADHRVQFRRTGTTRNIHFSAKSVRRIQLDIEQHRPASLVIVPDEPGIEAEVLTIDRSQFEAMSTAFLHLAIDLDDVGRA